jgi:hypothetical protein
MNRSIFFPSVAASTAVVVVAVVVAAVVDVAMMHFSQAVLCCGKASYPGRFSKMQ